MVDVASPKHDLVSDEDEKVKIEVLTTPPSLPKTALVTNITRLPDYDDEDEKLPISPPPPPTPSTYHIYSQHPCHKIISPTPDPTKDRRSGPKISEIKACRKSKKIRKASGLPLLPPDPHAFFLHQPYLAFHLPPAVLHTGTSRHSTTPSVLIHQSCFWRKYTLQLIPSRGVLDPRGVVRWPHNSSAQDRKTNPRALKGYKVRTWRLWGESGKAYVKAVKAAREGGGGSDLDPDIVLPGDNEPVCADEVVQLSWTSPLSRQARKYGFVYRGVEFFWKGTGTVREGRACGWFLRFSHLKLVARVSCRGGGGGDEKGERGKEEDWVEVCLGKFTSSVAKQKSGTLELFDAALLRLVEEHMPSVLGQVAVEGCEGTDDVLRQSDDEKILRLKRSTLYQVIVATATCMIAGEKEKRHTIIDLILGAAEQGAGGGG